MVLKTPEEIAQMRKAGQIVAQVLALLESKTRPGVTTAALDRVAEEECKRCNAIPVFRNYPNSRRGKPPFPGVICASVNDEVVHGIPGSRVLQEGDILKVDFGVMYAGFAGDSAITIPVGGVEARILRLLQATEESLFKGIEQAVAGRRLGCISNAIQRHAEQQGFSVVRAYTGHGIGREMHEDPAVPNYGPCNQGPLLKEGMALAIEPMLNMGTHRVYVKPDGWTVATCDGSYSAHFEHSIAITENGPEILTLR